MPILMGPVLKFRGYNSEAAEWQLSALVVAADDPGPLTCRTEAAGQEVMPISLWQVGGRAAYRYQFSVPLADHATTLTYTVGGQTFTVALPKNGYPPQMAYASCNGFSSLAAMKGVKDNNYLWRRLMERHGAAPYHLLIMGGDQVYADSMWETLQAMKQWSELPFQAANEAPFTPIMRDELEQFYFGLYTSRWAQPEVAQALASIPTIMMWDDHDIVDGWGSHLAERQSCAVFQGMWQIARRAFAVFQQHHTAEPEPVGLSPDHGFSFGHVIGSVAILALDMRSERTITQVISPGHWSRIYDWMSRLPSVDHLVVMSSIPIVYPGFDTIERILGWMPGQQELEDDLRDHWNSRPHKAERLRLIHRLLELSKSRNVRPTIISGDVHVGAIGLIESQRDISASSGFLAINQLISSGIVHPGPPAVILFALAHLFDNEDEIDRGIMARMIEFPGTKEKFIGRRNFLSLEPDDQKIGARYWANWIVEGEDTPYTKVIHGMKTEVAVA